MANTAISFEWSKGYTYEVAGDGKVIRQSHRGRDRLHPLDLHKTLYLDFAALDGSPEACLKFARAWGLLTEKAKLDAAEPLELWREKIRRMKSWTHTAASLQIAGRTHVPVTAVDVMLAFDNPGIRPALVLRPRTLLDAMLTQFALSRAGGNQLATCEQCAKLFETGTGGKRSVARFCSDECRNRFHYERRAGK